jgi:ribosomal protein L11 methyltransferase
VYDRSAVNEALLIGSRLRLVTAERGSLRDGQGSGLGGPAEALLDGRVEIVVVPGAFGSGEHDTTSSCLELLETLPTLAGARLLDVGSGTGILAIAALKLGAARAVCLDIDPRAVATARLACAINGVAERVDHVNAELGALAVNAELGALAGAGFDIVVANLYGDLLIQLAAELLARAKPGATLLLSGILWELGFDVRQCFARLGCTLERERMLAEHCTMLWRTACVERPHGTPGVGRVA